MHLSFQPGLFSLAGILLRVCCACLLLGHANCQCTDGQYSGSCPGGYSCSPYTYINTCSPCQPGYYSAEGVTSCSNCPTGTVSGDCASSCRACAAGTYYVSATTCTNCESGKYRTGLDTNLRSSCLICPVGTSSPSSGASSCTACAAGTYYVSATTCTDCDSGKYRTAGLDADPQSSCLICPAGTSSPSSGASSCTACAPGTYQPVSGALTCINCESGKFQEEQGQTSCNSCPPGHFCPVLGSTYASRCPAGKYSEDAWASCLKCPTGTTSHSGADTCRDSSSADEAMATIFWSLGTVGFLISLGITVLVTKYITLRSQGQRPRYAAAGNIIDLEVPVASRATEMTMVEHIAASPISADAIFQDNDFSSPLHALPWTGDADEAGELGEGAAADEGSRGTDDEPSDPAKDPRGLAEYIRENKAVVQEEKARGAE